MAFDEKLNDCVRESLAHIQKGRLFCAGAAYRQTYFTVSLAQFPAAK
jgi:hypothetical protein